MSSNRTCPRCNGYLLRVSGRDSDHYECLNCGFSDEPSPMTTIEARHEADRARVGDRNEVETPAGD